MKKLFSIELYKLGKANNYLLVALLLLYPVMWSILVYRNEVVLLENGHSMISWVLTQLFALDKAFVLTLAFSMAANEIIFKEKERKYFVMIENRGNANENIYRSKAIALMIYFICLLIITILATCICYFIFVKSNPIISTGAIYNRNELKPGIEILSIYFIDKCILFPLVFALLSSRFRMGKTFVIILCLNFIDRGLALIPEIYLYSIWGNYKYVENFVDLCKTDSVNVHVRIYLMIGLYCCLIWVFIKKRRVKNG